MTPLRNPKNNDTVFQQVINDHHSLLLELYEKFNLYSVNVERNVIGGLIINNELISESIKTLDSDDFYFIHNKIIYSTIIELYNSGKAISEYSIQTKLESDTKNNLSETKDISEYTNPFVFSRDCLYGLLILKEYSMKRKFVTYCCTGISEVLDNEDILEVQSKYSELFSSMTDFIRKIKKKSKLDVSMNVMNRIERALSGDFTGVATGLTLLDNITNGLQNGNLITLAARTMQGKSAIALQMAYTAAVKNKIPVTIIQLEMTEEELHERLVSIHTGIPYQDMRTGANIHDKVALIGDTMSFINESPLNCIADVDPTLDNVVNICRNAVKREGSRLLVIDYLDYIESVENKNLNTPDVIGNRVKKIKRLALELNVPIILIVQLNRNTEHRENREPMLSDLRSSGAIEFMSDMVLMLYRPELYFKDDEEKLKYVIDHKTGETISMKDKAFLIVAKHKQGETLKMVLNTNMSCSRFWNFRLDKIPYTEPPIPPEVKHNNFTEPSKESDDIPF